MEWYDKLILIGVGINLLALIADIILKFKFSPQEKGAMEERIDTLKEQNETLKMRQVTEHNKVVEEFQKAWEQTKKDLEVYKDANQKLKELGKAKTDIIEGYKKKDRVAVTLEEENIQLKKYNEALTKRIKDMADIINSEAYREVDASVGEFTNFIDGKFVKPNPPGAMSGLFFAWKNMQKRSTSKDQENPEDDSEDQ